MSIVEVLAVYLDIDNQLDFLQKQLWFNCRSVYIRYINHDSKVYECESFVRYNLSSLDLKQLQQEELVRL